MQNLWTQKIHNFREWLNRCLRCVEHLLTAYTTAQFCATFGSNHIQKILLTLADAPAADLSIKDHFPKFGEMIIRQNASKLLTHLPSSGNVNPLPNRQLRDACITLMRQLLNKQRSPRPRPGIFFA